MNLEKKMDYHTDTTALNKTHVMTFAESREDYDHQFITCDVPRKEPTKPMLTGTLCHSVLLEGKSFDDSIAIYPQDCLTKAGSLHPTRAIVFRAENSDRLCIKELEAESLVDLVKAMTKCELRDLIANATHREQIIYGSHAGRAIKCKPDFMGILDDRVCIYDLKFAGKAKPKLFERTCKGFSYWMQDAHYSAVMKSNSELPVVFRFIAVETSKPYRVDWYEYDLRSREIAAEKWALILADMIECERTGEYKDCHKHMLTLAPWDIESNEDGELVEIGDAA